MTKIITNVLVIFFSMFLSMSYANISFADDVTTKLQNLSPENLTKEVKNSWGLIRNILIAGIIVVSILTGLKSPTMGVAIFIISSIILLVGQKLM